jgi:hypothetical protein
VQAADALARKLGAHPSPAPAWELLEQPAVAVLGLTDLELAVLLVDLEDELNLVRAMF